MRTCIALALGALVLTPCVDAQSRGGSDQDDRRPQISVENYTIDVTVNPETQTINTHAAVRFTSEDGGASPLVFELNNALSVARVTDERGQSLQSSRTQSDSTVRVSPPAGLQAGRPTTITFDYDGRLSGTEESPIYGITFAAINKDFAYLLYPARWFPVSGYSANRFTSTINVTVPNGYRVIGSGDAKTKNAADATTWSFQFPKASFPGDIAITKGDPIRSDSSGIVTTLYFRGADTGVAKAYGDSTADMVAHFASLFGMPPYTNLTVFETGDGAPNGYSAPGIVFLSPAAIGKEVNANVLANQVARQWWEVSVSPVNRNHLWLENGLALYSEALWTEKSKSAAAFTQRMKDIGINALTTDTVPLIQAARMEDYSPEYWALTADKGATVIHMLRSTIGDEKFFRSLKEFVQLDAWKSVTTEDFRKVTETVTGQELRYFFLQWVEANAAPEFKLEWTMFRVGGKGFRVQGKISQDLDTFRMPVELKIETEGNPETKTIEVMGTSSEFSVDTFGKPRNVILDPDNKLLRLSPQVRVSVAIRKGEQLTQVGEFNEALREFQRALDTQRNSSTAHYRVGEVFFLQHNYQSAANEFREALNGDLQPKWIEVWSHIYLGKIFDVTGQRERAVNEYTQAQRTRDNTQGAQDEAAKYLKQPFKTESKEAV